MAGFECMAPREAKSGKSERDTTDPFTVSRTRRTGSATAAVLKMELYGFGNRKLEIMVFGVMVEPPSRFLRLAEIG